MTGAAILTGIVGLTAISYVVAECALDWWRGSVTVTEEWTDE